MGCKTSYSADRYYQLAHILPLLIPEEPVFNLAYQGGGPCLVHLRSSLGQEISPRGDW